MSRRETGNVPEQQGVDAGHLLLGPHVGAAVRAAVAESRRRAIVVRRGITILLRLLILLEFNVSNYASA